jgi:hypothetical protein
MRLLRIARNDKLDVVQRSQTFCYALEKLPNFTKEEIKRGTEELVKVVLVVGGACF